MHRRDTFHETDLVKVDEYENPVILKSGGPIMEAESPPSCLKDKVLCRWEEDGKIVRAVFPRACLYRLVPFQSR
jgi:uncharacterized protein YodC (DUF2158 family)